MQPRKGFLVWLGGLSVLGFLATDMYLPAFAAMQEDLQTPAAAISASLSLFLAGFAFAQLLWGPLSDRFGRKPVLLLGLAIFAVGVLYLRVTVNIPPEGDDKLTLNLWLYDFQRMPFWQYALQDLQGRLRYFTLQEVRFFPFHYPNAVDLLFYTSLTHYRLYIIAWTGAAAFAVSRVAARLGSGDALALGGCDAVKTVLVYERTPTACAMVAGRDITFTEALAGQSTECPAVPVNAEHPLFILYTSGSTGKPKGVQHSTGGYLLWAKMTMDWTFDLRADDIFWCTADIGWITGHTYVAYGPLAAGATQIIFEGIPTFPNAGRFWQMIERHKCTIFYTAPTAIRSLIKAAEADEAVHPARSDLSSLRILGSVGEPINPEAWMWYHKNVGGERCPIVDTFWQTETGGHVITPLPGATPLVPGSCTLPLPGITAAIVDEMGNDVPNGSGGILVIKRPWPSMIRTIWNDPERFKKSYFPEELKGYYLAGDGAVRSADRGYFRITGRIDDVLNVSGHRMGTMEIESALVAKTDLVAEAAVVGRPDDVTGEAICAFVVLKRSRPTGEEAKQIANELRNWVAKEIGPIAKPKDIRFGDNLPKTRSGKIMRRLLRSIAKGEAITQDTSTLENPAILDQLAQTN